MDDEEDDEAIGCGLCFGSCTICVFVILWGLYELNIVICEIFIDYNTTWNQSEVAMHDMPCFPFVTLINIGFMVVLFLVPFILWKRHVLFR